VQPQEPQRGPDGPLLRCPQCGQTRAESYWPASSSSMAIPANRATRSASTKEAEWLARASQIPGVRERVARHARYDSRRNVHVRECVPRTVGTPRQTSKLFDIHQGIRAAIAPYSWLAPEFKEDSYVMVRGRDNAQSANYRLSMCRGWRMQLSPHALHRAL
jgi:hypothetical protein